MTTNKLPILEKLETKEKFEKRILRQYHDILYRTFQVIYEADAKVEWQRIFRFSAFSNFIMISGLFTLEKGSKVGENVIDEEVNLDISFTIPWKMLDDGSTPYQIADAARELEMVRHMVDGKQYTELLRSKDFTMEDAHEYLPEVKDLREEAKEPEPEVPKVLSGFKLDDLTEEQKQSLLLNSIKW